MRPNPIKKFEVPATVLIVLVATFRLAQPQSHIGELLPKAQAGDAAAQYLVSQILYYGQESRLDQQAGARWACEAAWQGDVQGQRFLAELYGAPISGATAEPFPRNVETAFYWATVAFRAMPAAQVDTSPTSRGPRPPMKKQAKKKKVDSSDSTSAVSLRSTLSQELSYQDVIVIEEAAAHFSPIKTIPWRPSGKCDSLSEGMLFKKK